MGRQVTVPAGTTQRILWIYSSSIPGQIRFRAEPINDDTLSGQVELRRRAWFSWKSEKHELAPRNIFEKGMADGDYRILVTPDQDTRITFETRHFRTEYLFYILGGMVALALLAGLTAVLLRSAG